MSLLPPSVYVFLFCIGVPVNCLEGKEQLSLDKVVICLLNFCATLPLYCTQPREAIQPMQLQL